MPFLRFKLKNYDEIAFFYRGNENYANWFSLTDSFYWFNFDGIELLRYNEIFINKNNQKNRMPYVDYYFARIYEDFMEILPNILEPIPNEIFDLVDKSDGIKNFEILCNIWFDKVIKDEEKDYDSILDEIYYPALNWLYLRKIDFGYLIGAPDIYFLRNKDKIHIYWSCEGRDLNDNEIWKEKNGSYILEVDMFIKEIFDSFEDFIDNMDKRVNHYINSNLLQGIRIDVSLLKNEQFDRKNNFYQQKMLIEKANYKTCSDWLKIKEAICRLKEMVK